MSQLNSVWSFSDNPERYAELFGGAQQWGQQVYAIVQKYRAGAGGSYALWAKMHLCSGAKRRAVNVILKNYAESIAALLKDKHSRYVVVGRDETW